MCSSGLDDVSFGESSQTIGRVPAGAGYKSMGHMSMGLGFHLGIDRSGLSMMDSAQKEKKQQQQQQRERMRIDTAAATAAAAAGGVDSLYYNSAHAAADDAVGEGDAASTPELFEEPPLMQPAVPPSLKDFRLGCILGQGSFGVVVHCEYKHTGGHYAMKIVDRQFLLRHGMLQTIMLERQLLSILPRHPNIVSTTRSSNTISCCRGAVHARISVCPLPP
jgi:hypothetical protein